ncbi:Hypothetical protein NTJ_02820 [Nesidiocoris tenuis]|uniref:Uncharacterized protein n=1 Tax=Nesidiocoris tenuis TaxID=355587 RepID=A0ABN7ACJ3_9HEMI|nr:Hypothetical protein NTJ_02820 [Nesidiocoris tenuis]
MRADAAAEIIAYLVPQPALRRAARSSAATSLRPLSFSFALAPSFSVSRLRAGPHHYVRRTARPDARTRRPPLRSYLSTLRFLAGSLALSARSPVGL